MTADTKSGETPEPAVPRTAIGLDRGVEVPVCACHTRIIDRSMRKAKCPADYGQLAVIFEHSGGLLGIGVHDGRPTGGREAWVDGEAVPFVCVNQGGLRATSASAQSARCVPGFAKPDGAPVQPAVGETGALCHLSGSVSDR